MDLEPVATEIEVTKGPSLDQLIQGLSMLDEARQALADAGDWETLAWGKKRLAEFATQLRAVSSKVDADLVDLIPDGQADVDGLGRIQVRWARKRSNWQSNDLLRWIIRRALVNPETGERLELTADEAADRIFGEVSECMPVRPSTSWRTKPLKERGLQLDEWCSEDPPKASVSITGAN